MRRSGQGNGATASATLTGRPSIRRSVKTDRNERFSALAASGRYSVNADPYSVPEGGGRPG